MEALTLKLTTQELQTTLRALGNLPYIQVQELIGKIQVQAMPQLQGMNGKQEEHTTPPAKKAGKAEKAA